MLHGRLAEWLTSGVMVMFAVTLALPGDTVEAGNAFLELAFWGFTEVALAAPPAAIGGARLMALYVNGSWRRSPMIRTIGAALGAGMFTFLTIGFAWPYLAGISPALSPAVGTYGVLALFDILAAYRSGQDHKRQHHTHDDARISRT